MKIPSRLKIGAHTFEVRVEDNWPGKGDTVGLCDREKNTIHVDSKLAQSYQWSTLLHEILHAINSEIDHAILDSLAEQLNQVLCDNQFVSKMHEEKVVCMRCGRCGVFLSDVPGATFLIDENGNALCEKCGSPTVK